MRTKNSHNFTRRQFLQTTVSGGLYAAYVLTSGCALWRDFDLLIRGGMVLDGTGSDPVRADVGIKNRRILAIGDLGGKSAKRVLDARNLVVAPGFIDIHSHSDNRLLVDGHAQSKIRQGVTTEVVGQDGDSVAPLNAAMRTKLDESLQKDYGLAADWTDFSGYFARLRQQGISVNLASMVGTGTLREHVVGYENRPATADELNAMGDLLLQCLAQGARHLSSGLEYTPGSFADEKELAILAGHLGGNGVYATHMRNEDDRLLEAVAEAVAIARDSSAALNISHIKASGKRNWGKLDAVFKILDEARTSGLKITCDRYPYVAYSTGLTALFPLWSREGESALFIERLQNTDLIPRLREAVETKIDMLGSWDAVMIASLANEEHSPYVGMRLGELARSMGQDPFEVLRTILIEENGRGGMVGFAMSEENTSRVLAYPYCVIASDGSAVAVDGPLSRGNPHPRSFGTFPRVLGHYVRETGTLTLAEAVRKMTALPAAIVGVTDRGRLAENFWADVTIFDPTTVADTATFTEPKQYPVGIEYVIVNGEVVIDQGEHTHAKPGMIV